MMPVAGRQIAAGLRNADNGLRIATPRVSARSSDTVDVERRHIRLAGLSTMRAIAAARSGFVSVMNLPQYLVILYTSRRASLGRFLHTMSRLHCWSFLLTMLEFCGEMRRIEGIMAANCKHSDSRE